jgi:phosphoribosylformylglycinamidine synthase II
VLASATLEDGAGESRPSVQIGDPFAEKLLIEASLEMVERGLLQGLQDLGGAGLTCAVSESAARAGLGADLDLDAVPLRAPGMEPFEILTSESQERMLAVVSDGYLREVREVCDRWGIQSSEVGHLTPDGRLRVHAGGDVVADVPARSLVDEGPEYDRPMAPPGGGTGGIEDDPTFATVDVSPADAFLRVLGSPNVASKRRVFEQYDQLVGGNTVAGPGGDAAVIRIDGTLKAIAVATDGKGRYGHLDPYLGAAHAVAEAARNVACAGARPLAITNCLNFGDPERPEVMWQFAESVRGMGDACRALGTPVTGGNVSFYNESGGSAIWPTPVIGMLGLIDDYRLMLRPAFTASGRLVYVVGDTIAELGGSEFAEAVLGRVSGRPPALDLAREAALHRLLVEGAKRDAIASAHDCGDGGLAVALAECAIAGGTGFAVTLPGDAPWYVSLFSESASRAVISVDAAKSEFLERLATELSVPATRIGETGGPRMVFDSVFETTVEEADAVYEGALPRMLAG